MELTDVSTPSNIFDDKDQRTMEEIGYILTKELNAKGCWSQYCTETMNHSSKCLFLYDRLEYAIGKAYGNPLYKLLLNPCMVLCYHPHCLKRKKVAPIKLRRPCHIIEFIHHIQAHVDEIGYAMQLRFQAVFDNCFCSEEELDAVSVSPFCLQPAISLSREAVEVIEKFGICRDLLTNYICHWKDKLVTSKMIDSSTLTFQEDDAMIYTLLQHPDPIPDWSVWQTIYLYAVKLYTSISASALALYRGESKNRIADKIGGTTKSAKTCASEINHPAPSISTVQRFLPGLDYGNKVYHPGEILFHLKLLENHESSFRINFSSKVIRYPVCLGVDEQEINQGTFIHEGQLFGLQYCMSASDIRNIGIPNIGKYISENNHFNIAVREYRILDFAGLFSSNAYTAFESHSLKSHEVSKGINDVVTFVTVCQNCILLKQQCCYEQINKQCEKCEMNDIECKSMAVFHVLWDMGSSHKKMEKESDHLEEDSTDVEMLSRRKYTIGFGGLHLCKCLVNTSRNHVIKYNGHNFGVNILLACKGSSDMLQTIKTAVFAAKDRQSDLLAYLTVCPIVQEALKKLNVYCVQRLPEKYMPYKAKSQKKLILPVDLCTNENGDVFVLDAGAACVHVVDRGFIANVRIVGTYDIPDIGAYTSKNELRHVKFSCLLIDITADMKNNLYICDSGRKEVVVLPKFLNAKSNSVFYILKIDALSIVFTDNLFVLKMDGANKVVQKLSFDLPEKPSATKQFNINFDVIMKIVINDIDLTKLFYLPFAKCFGGMDDKQSLYVLKIQSKCSFSTNKLNLKSEVKPHVSNDGVMVTFSGRDVQLHKIVRNNETLVENFFFQYHVGDEIVTSVYKRGNVLSVLASCRNINVLLEYGSLEFSVEYCNAVCLLYDAIGYIPPRGNNKLKGDQTLEDCIKLAEVSVKLLNSMQMQMEDTVPNRKSFAGPDGMPSSDTINCLSSTVKSWKVILERFDRMEKYSTGLCISDIYTPAITSESIVEHSFGFTKKKGQGHNQNQYEYVNSKRSNAVDFQLRMCKMPFNQKIKEKKKDKGYQDIEGKRVNMSLTQLREIFCKTQEQAVVSEEISEEDMNILKKAYLISKSVPRQSSRAKWRAASSYQPEMLIEQCVSGFLCKDDLVCTRSITNDLQYLVVKCDVSLSDVDVLVPVAEVADDSTIFHIKCDKLIHQKGHILTAPKQFYVIENGQVEISQAMNSSFQFDHEVSIMSDEELSLLLEDNKNEDSTGKSKRKNFDLIQSSVSKVPRVAGCEVEESAGPSLPKLKYIPLNHSEVLIGNWVMVQYEEEDFLGVVLEKKLGGVRVRCLEKPYGVRLAQEFEKEVDAVFYEDVYPAPIKPWATELDDEGKRSRKTFYKY